MKAMKKLKSMKKSKIGRKHMVFNGLREKTSGGLTKDKLTKNKAGKIVSKAMSQQAKKNYSKTIGGWNKAVAKARKELGIEGFVALNHGAAGKALYAKAKAAYNAAK